METIRVMNRPEDYRMNVSENKLAQRTGDS